MIFSALVRLFEMLFNAFTPKISKFLSNVKKYKPQISAPFSVERDVGGSQCQLAFALLRHAKISLKFKYFNLSK